MSSAEALKARGNAHYAAGEIEDAIAAYTKAIVMNPNVAAFYTNRALCHLKLKRWDQVVSDCEKALSLDDESCKAHYLLGHAFLELNLPDRSVHSLQRAHELSMKRDMAYSTEISALLLQAKKRRWEEAENKRLASASDMLRYLSRLIEDDTQRSIDALDANASAQEREALRRAGQSKQAELQQVFEQANENMKRREIPDFMFSNISFELLRDPVIAPSGITYERESIIEHLRRVGHFDPVTRTRLTERQLIPNLVMREVVEDFMSKNGWAADF